MASTTLSEVAKDIAAYLEAEYNFKLPDSFLKNGNTSDIRAFIDIEKLFLDDFKFLNQKSHNNNIESFYKINKQDFCKYKPDEHYDNEANSEIKDIGMGYAEKSSEGNGPNLKEAEKIHKLFKSVDTSKHKNLYQIAKQANLLPGIAIDKITDFYVKYNEERLKDSSKNLIFLAKNDLQIDFSVNEIIDFYQKTYYKNTRKEGFPHFAPLEICESQWNTLGEEFNNNFYESVLEKKGINFSNEKYKDLSSFKKKNKYLLEEYNKILSDQETKNKLKKEIEKEIEELQILSDKCSNLNYLKFFDKTWKMNFALNDFGVLERLGLDKKVIIYKNDKDVSKILNFFIKGNELLVLNIYNNNLALTKEKLELIISKVSDMSYLDLKKSSKKIFLTNKTNTKNIGEFVVKNFDCNWDE